MYQPKFPTKQAYYEWLSHNFSGTGNPFYGKQHTPESLAKIGAASKDRKHSIETRTKISIAVKQALATEEIKKKMSLAGYGRPKTPEHRAAISRALIGRRLSPEHLEKALFNLKIAQYKIKRTYTLNESVFDNPNEEANYWIGFLMADGNVYIDNGLPNIRLALAEKDVEHLEKYRKFMGSSHPFLYNEIHRQYQ
jgi:NUMOD3 motif